MIVVRCIDAANVSLSVQHFYKATQHPSDPDRYMITENGFRLPYMKARFVEFPVFKVRAKQNTTTLSINPLYEVIQHPIHYDRWLIDPYDNSSSGHYKIRFSDPIDNRVPMDSKPLPIGDLIEAKLRKILTTRAYPDECVCGTTRSICRYHRNT